MKIEYNEEMLEQEAINKYLNMIANDYNGELAKTFQEKYINKEKEIERLKANYERIYNENCKLRKEHNINDITLLDKNERLNNIIKDIKSQLDYLETYSSKEDVFEDMKRRLDRIDKIISSIRT